MTEEILLCVGYTRAGRRLEAPASIDSLLSKSHKALNELLHLRTVPFVHYRDAVSPMPRRPGHIAVTIYVSIHLSANAQLV
jgi:hypothetical protein